MVHLSRNMAEQNIFDLPETILGLLLHFTSYHYEPQAKNL